MYSSKLSTPFILSLALILAILSNLPFYASVFQEYWPIVQGFPLGWLSIGMSYMAIFFHEIGHTLFMWFYGYPTVPVFDFAFGGGFAFALMGQKIWILFMVWGFMAYAFWRFREYSVIRKAIVFAFILNLSFAFNVYHSTIFGFAGPAFECLVASFFLIRALFDLAPRGDLERFLNAFFGFGMILQVFVNGVGLLNSAMHRLAYYNQKGSHGFGDFNKIADQIAFLDFQGVVCVWLVLNTLCLVLPFTLFVLIKERED